MYGYRLVTAMKGGREGERETEKEGGRRYDSNFVINSE